MKKKLVAMLLTAALVMTNSGFVYAAETGNTAADEAQKTEETDLAETDQEPEEEQQNPVVQEKNEEEPVQSTPAEQPAQPEEHEESVQVQSVQGDFEYTVSDGTVTITKYTGTGGDVTVPETIDGMAVTVIGESAFAEHTDVTRVAMPDNVTEVRSNAFANCTALNKINLPSGLTYLGHSAFWSCTSLTEIEIPASLEKTADEYDYTGPFAKSGLKEVKFEEGTTQIAERLFKDCAALEDVIIPDSVTEIETEAFYKCTGLKSVEFGKNVEVIWNGAFRECTGLVQVELPDTVTRIEQDAFAGDTALNKVNLPSGLTYLGHSAFWSCISLTEIKIPASLEKTANEYDYMGPFAQSGLKEVTFEEGTTKIAERLFKNCTSLEEIKIPDSVTEIETDAFYQCTGLKNVEFGKNVEVIWNWAFRGCTGLVQVELPDTVTRIEQDAFSDNIALEQINLPSGLTYLGHSAFRGCTSLTEIEIPASLEKTADEYDYMGPFAQSGLKKVTFEEGTTKIAERLFKDCASLEEIRIPNGVTEIGREAFRQCTGLARIEIADTVARIEDNAFQGDTVLKEVNLPAGLIYIGAYAFEDMQNLVALHIPDSVTKIDRDILQRSENAIIYCGANSYALEYALDNGYMFSVIDWDSYEPNVLNKQESFYTANSEAQSGFMDMIVHYALKEESANKIEDKEISVFLPSNLQLIEGTVRVGQTVLDTYSYQDNRLTIPVEEEEGTIRFSINPVESGSLSTAAWMSYTEDGKEDKDIIAVYTLDKDYLTLISNDLTSDSQVEFEGVAPAGSTVTVFVDQEQKIQVTAAESGYYSGQTELTDPQDGKTYTLTASVQNGSETLSKSVSVKYDLSNPVIEEFKLYYSDHDRSYVYDLMNKETLTKTIVFYPQAGYSFQVKMSHPERIDKLYVKSTRGGMTRHIEAEYDEASGYFVTSDKFEEGNNNYVPGMLSVDYELDYEKIYDSPENRAEEILSEYTNSNMVTGDEIQDVEVTDSGVKCTLNVTDDIKLDYQYREYTESEFLGFLKEEGLIEQDQFSDSRATKDIPDITGLLEELLKSFVVNGVETYTGSIDGDYYTVQYDDAEKVFKTWVLKIPFQYAAQEEIEDICFSVWGNASSEVLEEAQGAVFGFAWDSGSALIQYMGTMWELDMQIRPGMTEYEKAQIEAARSTAFCMLAMRVINAALPMVVGAAGGIPGMIVVGIAQYIIGDWIDTNGNVAEMKAISRFVAIQLSKCFSWIIDPSGYVYEAVLDNRLPGVTVTAYWKTDENAEAVLWNALEYQQQNPLLTDSSGAYAWDVPRLCCGMH